MNNFWEKLMCCVYKIGYWIKGTILDIPSFIRNLGFCITILFLSPFAKCGNKKAQLKIATIAYTKNNFDAPDILKFTKKLIGCDVLFYWLEDMAKENNPQAMYLLGEYFMDKSSELQNSMFNDTKNLSIEELNKNIAEIDKKHELLSEKLLQIHNKAFAWYKKAADLNVPDAQFKIFFNPREFNLNEDEKTKYLKQAAENGHPVACYIYAQHLEEIDNLKEAVLFMERAAKAKKSEWNHVFRFHRKYAKDWVKEFTNIVEVQEKALSGDAEAMYRYSEYFWRGNKSNRSLYLAHQWNTKAAQAGFPLAMAYEGIYIIHNWVEGTLEDSFNYFQKAVDAGCKIAHEGLGDCYLYGWGVEQNYEKAKYHFKIVKMGYRLKGITAKNIKEKVDGEKALENDRNFHN